MLPSKPSACFVSRDMTSWSTSDDVPQVSGRAIPSLEAKFISSSRGPFEIGLGAATGARGLATGGTVSLSSLGLGADAGGEPYDTAVAALPGGDALLDADTGFGGVGTNFAGAGGAGALRGGSTFGKSGSAVSTSCVSTLCSRSCPRWMDKVPLNFIVSLILGDAILSIHGTIR